MGLMGKLRRTNMCGELRQNNIDNEVTLMGWVQNARNMGKLVFIDLRDITGITQIVFNENSEFFTLAQSLRGEDVIAIQGIVKERSSKNNQIATGDIEVIGSNLVVLDKANTPPIYIKDDDNVKEEMRLKYRYLDLRKPKMQKTLMLRSKFMNVVRNFYTSKGFNEIETPILGKSTPEGARDYLVPSRVNPGKFYALPQSPQILKQLLMIAGMDKYFQIAKCFRDEDLRTNRQPEFTQIDVEMSFIDVDDIISIHEELFQILFKEFLNIDLELPLRRMTFNEAMERYGVDKPDLRFDMELKNLNSILSDTEFDVFNQTIKNNGTIRAINVPSGCELISKKKKKKLEEFVKDFKAKGLININYDEEKSSSIDKFINDEIKDRIFEFMKSEPGDMVLIVCDSFKVTSQSLGNLRNYIANEFNMYNKDEFNLLWVVDFPMFEYDEEEKRYYAQHHPFTSPKDECLENLESNPDLALSKGYDIVINGEELGGGSIRINDSTIQSKIFKILGFTEETAKEQFGFLLEALSYGTPPHGGIALGLDRWIQLFTNNSNIRDVIAFPKTQSAFDLMSDAPSAVSEDQLNEVSIMVKDEK